MMHCIFIHGIVKNQHFQSTLFGGRGHKKSNVCYFYNVDNSGRSQLEHGLIHKMTVVLISCRSSLTVCVSRGKNLCVAIRSLAGYPNYSVKFVN